MINTSINLENSLLGRIKERAKIESLSVSAMVRLLLLKALDEKIGN